MDARGDAGNEAVELEARREDTFSWHPCQVSLRSPGLGLLVQYKDGDSEEIIADEEGVLARIRVRSSPLEGDDCTSIQQGDHVLATDNSHVEGIFCDARIEKAIRVRHSKRSYCRCSFTIKWLDNVFKAEAPTLPASAIMKLSRSSIKLHPTISAFFSMAETSNSIDVLPFSTTSDDMDCEMDINVMLEKQIKEITHSNDVSAKVSRKIFVGLEGQSHGKAAAAFFEDLCTKNNLVTNLRRSTRSKNVQSVVTIMEKPSVPSPTVQEEFTGIKSPLNPLAAWAALASMRSKFPQSAEVSSLSNEFPLNVSATLEGKNPKYEGIVKTLFANSNASQIAELPNVPIGAHGNRLAKRNRDSGNKVIPCPEIRATRAQTQSKSGTRERAPMPDTNDKQSRSSKTRRFTRSAVTGAENMSPKLAKSECDAHHLTAMSISGNKISVASSVDGETNASDEIAENLSGKDGVADNVDSPQGNFIEEAKKLNSSRRVTRSGAQDRTEKNNSQPEQEQRKHKPCKSNELKLENNVISNGISSELRISTRSTSAAKVSAWNAKERENSTPNTSESFVNRRQGRKKPTNSNSRMQATRSSPRLNILPQAHSQT